MKLKQRFYAVAPGDIYPRWFDKGEECPDALLDAARAVGAVGGKAKAQGDAFDATDNATDPATETAPQ